MNINNQSLPKELKMKPSGSVVICLLSLLVILCGACQSKKGKSTEMNSMEKTKDNTVSIDAQANVVGGKLEIRYTILNNSSESIYLVNQLFKWTKKGFECNQNIAYTERNGTELLVYKACREIPDDLLLESPDVPYLSEVTVGNRFEEIIRLDLPVSPWSPFNIPKVTDQEYPCASLVFEVGVLPISVPTVSVKTMDGQERTSAKFKNVLSNQQLLRSELKIETSTNF